MAFQFNLVAAIALQMVSALALQMSSLGSSYAAGPGLPTGSIYASLFANSIGANLTRLAISGSTLSQLGTQVANLPGNADIVTITSGGNDLGYIGGLGGMAGTPLISEATLLGRWNTALASIHAAAPNATVYVVEYLTILGPDVVAGSTVSFNASQVQHFRDIAATLQRATADAAAGKDWVVEVPIASLSVAHGLGSSEPWVNGATAPSGDGAAWHPNAAGMKAIADILCAKFKGT